MQMTETNHDSKTKRRIRLTLWKPSSKEKGYEGSRNAEDPQQAAKSKKVAKETSSTQTSSPADGTQPTSNAHSSKRRSHAQDAGNKTWNAQHWNEQDNDSWSSWNGGRSSKSSSWKSPGQNQASAWDGQAWEEQHQAGSWVWQPDPWSTSGSQPSESARKYSSHSWQRNT